MIVERERGRGRGRVGLVGLVTVSHFWRESVTIGQMGGEDSIRRSPSLTTDRSRCFERARIKSGIVFLLQEGNCSGGIIDEETNLNINNS